MQTSLIWAAATGVCLLLRPWLVPENLVLVYLVAVAIVSARFGAAESVFACLISVAALDFFFVQPRFSFAVSDAQYVVTFAIMLAVALFISGLSHRLRAQALAAAERERRTAILYALTRDLADTAIAEDILKVGAAEIAEAVGHPAAIVARASEVASGCERVPIGSSTKDFEIRSGEPINEQEKELVKVIASAVAVALERIRLTEESEAARVAAGTEHMRNVLLNSVSHDLRTPLTVIRGAASALLAQEPSNSELARTISDEAERLDRHIRNLLDMSRLESTPIGLNLQWHSIEELIGSALERTSSLLADHHVRTYIPSGLALVQVDGSLVEKALANLLENAAKHTPQGTEIEIRVTTPARAVRVQVADHGPGFPQGQEERVFERFVGSSKQGFGLGLAICKAVAEAHGGRVWAENRAGGGARFYLELPASRISPEVPLE